MSLLLVRATVWSLAPRFHGFPCFPFCRRQGPHRQQGSGGLLDRTSVSLGSWERKDCASALVGVAGHLEHCVARRRRSTSGELAASAVLLGSESNFCLRYLCDITCFILVYFGSPFVEPGVLFVECFCEEHLQQDHSSPLSRPCWRGPSHVIRGELLWLLVAAAYSRTLHSARLTEIQRVSLVAGRLTR